jgi:hypothetical protein
MSTWFSTKTPAETFERVVTEMMDQLGLERDDEVETAPASEGVMKFTTAPGLSFTRVLFATVAAFPVDKPNWANTLIAVIRFVQQSGCEGEELVLELQVPARDGVYDEEGFRYHPELRISIQGQSATDAWREIHRLAQKWKIPVTVRFQWRDNPKAQHPGKVAEIGF